MSNNKFMVQLFSGISPKHLFMMAFVGLTGFFVLIIYLNYRKTLRRNFRPGSDPGPTVRVDARQIANKVRERLPSKKD